MKLLLVVLSLVVLYCACISYAEKDVDSKEDASYSKEEYISNYQDVFRGRSLSRSKRSLITPLLKLFGKSFAVVIKPIIDLSLFTFEVLLGGRECANIKDVSKDLFPKVGSISIETIKIIICHIGNAIGPYGRAILNKMIQTFLLFIRKVCIPGLYIILNKAKDTGMLPSSINAMIDMFNITYKMMKLLGYL